MVSSFSPRRGVFYSANFLIVREVFVTLISLLSCLIGLQTIIHSCQYCHVLSLREIRLGEVVGYVRFHTNFVRIEETYIAQLVSLHLQGKQRDLLKGSGL